MDLWRTKLFLDKLDDRIVPDATPFSHPLEASHCHQVVIDANGYSCGAGVISYDADGSEVRNYDGHSCVSDGVFTYTDGHTCGEGAVSYDSDFTSATDTISYDTGDAATVTTLVAFADYSQSESQSAGLVLTATVTGSSAQALTGSVSFYDGGALVGMAFVNPAGVATCTVANPAAGLHVLTAAYQGGIPGDASVSIAVVTTVPIVTSVSGMTNEDIKFRIKEIEIRLEELAEEITKANDEELAANIRIQEAEMQFANAATLQEAFDAAKDARSDIAIRDAWIEKANRKLAQFDVLDQELQALQAELIRRDQAYPVLPDGDVHV